MKDSNLIKKITEAAIFVAIGIVMLLSFRFLELGSSSFFLIATLLAIYTYKNGIEYASIPGISLLALSFIVVSPLDVFIYAFPPLIAGILYGHMLKKNTNKYIRITTLVLFSLIFDVIGAFITAYIYNINIFTDYLTLFDNITKLLNINENSKIFNLIKCIVIGLIPSSFIISAVLNCYLVVLLCEEILYRLKLKNREIILSRVNIKKYLAVIFYVVLIVFNVYSYFIDYSNTVSMVFYSIILTIMIMLDFIMCYQVIIVASLYCNLTHKKWLYLIIAIATLVLFPIAAIVGTIFTFRDTSSNLLANANRYN